MVSYEIGAPGFDCAVGHVVSTHAECASSELITAVGISFSNWVSTHNLQFLATAEGVFVSPFFSIAKSDH